MHIEANDKIKKILDHQPHTVSNEINLWPTN